MRGLSRLSVVGLMLALVAGCGEGLPSGSGAVQMVIGDQEFAASESSVTRIQVVVSGLGITDIQQDLVKTGSTWGGTIAGIPAGTNRVIVVSAYGGSSLLYRGEATEVTIVEGETALVAVTLHDVSLPQYTNNDAPIIDSVTVSGTTVEAGGQLTLGATAHDPVPADLLAYAWTASAGTLSSATIANPTWTAPSSAQTVTLTLTVRDQRNGISRARVTVEVTEELEVGGSATISVSFNAPPLILLVTASEGRVVLGQSTAVSANVHDPDLGTVFYQWTSSCAGTFSSPTSQTSNFTPSAVPAGACNNCSITMTARDPKGGTRSGSYFLCVVSTPAP
ncbi:Ig-like domain-containing protein [Corallococcus terminator]